MEAELGVAPARLPADLAAGEAHPGALDPLGFRDLGHHPVQQLEEPPRLRRQLVQAPPQDLAGEAVGELDVVQLDLEVLHGETAVLDRLHLPLVLVKERDGVDQRQVLGMVPPGPGPGVEESQGRRVGVDHRERPKQPLGVSVPADDRLPVLAGQEAFERSALPLEAVDRPRLLPGLVDRQDQAAVEELLVDVDGGGGEKDRDRPLDPVLVGHEPAGLRVLARRGDRELAFGLEELQGVGGPLGALLLGDGQDLVGEIRLAHVEEALPRHRRVGHPLLLGHQIENRVHQGGLARGRARLEDDGERVVELAADGREVADQLVRLLAHDAAAGEVLEDSLQEPRVLEEVERLGPLLGRERDRRRLGLERAADLLLLELLELQEHAPQVLLHDVLGDVELLGRLVEEGHPLAGRVEVQRVHVEAGLRPAREDVHPQDVVGHVLRQAPDPVAPVPQADHHLLRAHLGRYLGRLGQGGRRGRCRRRGGRARLGRLERPPPGGERRRGCRGLGLGRLLRRVPLVRRSLCRRRGGLRWCRRRPRRLGRRRSARRSTGLGPLAQVDGVPEHEPQALPRRLDLQGVLVGVHAAGKLDAEAGDPLAGQALGRLGGGALAGVVPVERQEHPLDAVAPEGRQVVLGQTVDPVGGRDVLKARAPEGQGVDQRLGEDHLVGLLEGLPVPDAAVRAGQVEVARHPLLERPGDLPAVDLRHPARLVEDRDHDRAVEVLVAALAQDPQLGEPAPDLGAGLALLVR